MNSDKIKHFQTSFKEIVTDDKLYQPIYKSIAKELKLFPQFDQSQSDLFDSQKSLFLERQKSFAQIYQDLLDKHEMAYLKIIDKNQLEISTQSTVKNDKLNDLEEKKQNVFDEIEDEKSKIKYNYNTSIDEAQNILTRELATFKKNSQTARQENQILVNQIEQEFNEAKRLLEQGYDTELANFNNRKQEVEIKKSSALEKNQENHQSITTEHNDDYIAVKQTFNDVNVTLNAKINGLTKVHVQAVKKITDAYEESKIPILKAIEDQKISYKQIVDETKVTYANQLVVLDNDFVIKKDKYEAKKIKINHDTNEEISTYNSKLSAYRESTEKEKLDIIRTHRNDMKDKDESEQNRIARLMRQKLNVFDHDLDHMIRRTTKDLIKIKRNLRMRLFNLENSFLETRHELRIAKIKLTNEYRLNLAKIELNYNHNIASSKNLLNLYEIQFKLKKDALELVLRRDLLPLETQLAVETQVQERELNLLNGDQQIAISELKKREFEILKDYDLALEEIKQLEEKAKLNLNSELLVLNSNVQLEVEKARLQRDEAMSEQEHRSNLSNAIFEREKHSHEHVYLQSLLAFDHQYEMAKIQTGDQSFLIHRHEQLVIQKRESFMREADIKTKTFTALENTNHTFKLDVLNIENEQFHFESLIEKIIFFYLNIKHLKDIVKELYHLPSHPEIFKSLVSLLKSLTDELQTEIITEMDKEQLLFFDYIEKQKATLASNERTCSFLEKTISYQNRIEQLNKDQLFYTQLLSNNERKILIEKAKTEKSEAFIKQLENINQQIKAGLLPLSSIEDYHQNQKEIRKHHVELMISNKILHHIDKQVAYCHRHLIDIERQKQSFNKKIDRSSRRAVTETNNLQLAYDAYMNKVIATYNRFKHYFKGFIQEMTVFYDYLNQKTYLTENDLNVATQKLSSAQNQISKQIISYEQQFLKHLENLYCMYKNEHNLFINVLKNDELSLLESVEYNRSQLLKNTQKELKFHQVVINKSISIHNQDYKSHLEQLHIQYSKTLTNDQLKIHEFEDAIQSHLTKLQNELSAINENQHATALQYMNENDAKNHELDFHYEKHIRNIHLQYGRKISDVENDYKNQLFKNQTLLEKSQQQIISLRKQFEINKLQLEEQYLDKIKLIDLEKIKHEKHMKDMITNRNKSFDNLQKEMKKQENRLIRQEKRLLNQELAEERKSYKFITHSLDLD